MVEFRNRAHWQNKNGAVASAVLGKGAGVFITRPGEGCDGPTGALLEDLQSPTCPNCGIEMRWYGSELVRFVPATNLNLFNCPNCLFLQKQGPSTSPFGLPGQDRSVQAQGTLGRRSPSPRLRHEGRQDCRCGKRGRTGQTDLQTLSRTRRGQCSGSRSRGAQHPHQDKAACDRWHPRWHPVRTGRAVLSVAQPVLYW